MCFYAKNKEKNMVDAINGNYGAKSQDLSINWNDLTATEVLAYEDEGQDVPDAILAWAQEMAGTENADQITYEMYEENGESSSGNAATDLRQELSDSHLSLKAQGKIFIEQSKEKEDLTLQSITEMAPLLNIAQEIGTEAEAIGDAAKTQLESIKNQIQALISEKNDKPRLLQDRSERGEIQGLQAVAEALGANAEGQLQSLDAELDEVDEIVNNGALSSQTSIDFGSETVAIGNELLGDKGGRNIGIVAGVVGGALTGVGMLLGGLIGGIFGGLFGGKKKVGREAVEQGTQTMTVGQQGMQISEQAADAYGVSIKDVSNSENDVNNASEGTQTGDGSTGGEELTGGEDATAASSESVQEGSTEAEIDPTLADTSITTDPDEILRRKERRGLA